MIREFDFSVEIQVERLLDGQVNIRELPMLRELITLRKRIRNICNNWLKECRMTLGKKIQLDISTNLIILFSRIIWNYKLAFVIDITNFLFL